MDMYHVITSPYYLFYTDGEYRFLDLNTKIQKQIPRNFKSQVIW